MTTFTTSTAHTHPPQRQNTDSKHASVAARRPGTVVCAKRGLWDLWETIHHGWIWVWLKHCSKSMAALTQYRSEGSAMIIGQAARAFLLNDLFTELFFLDGVSCLVTLASLLSTKRLMTQHNFCHYVQPVDVLPRTLQTVVATVQVYGHWYDWWAMFPAETVIQFWSNSYDTKH